MGEAIEKKPTVTAVGIVKSFDDGSGNGLIAREGDEDVFVNREAITGDGPRTLIVGARDGLAVDKDIFVPFARNQTIS